MQHNRATPAVTPQGIDRYADVTHLNDEVGHMQHSRERVSVFGLETGPWSGSGAWRIPSRAFCAGMKSCVSRK